MKHIRSLLAQIFIASQICSLCFAAEIDKRLLREVNQEYKSVVGKHYRPTSEGAKVFCRYHADFTIDPSDTIRVDGVSSGKIGNIHGTWALFYNVHGKKGYSVPGESYVLLSKLTNIDKEVKAADKIGQEAHLESFKNTLFKRILPKILLLTIMAIVIFYIKDRMFGMAASGLTNVGLLLLGVGLVLSTAGMIMPPIAALGIGIVGMGLIAVWFGLAKVYWFVLYFYGLIFLLLFAGSQLRANGIAEWFTS